MTIKTIRKLQGAGVLADIAAKSPKRSFLRYNLIYGFNGSGKSTLSRLLGCLQFGEMAAQLPEGCSFEIEMDDGSALGGPDDLTGVEETVCVFNEDFIEKNLRWAEGKANSIFYLSEAQAELGKELKETEAKLPERQSAADAEKRVLAEREKTFATYKRERAKIVSAALHAGNRRYEAGQLQSDYEKLSYDTSSKLTADQLKAVDAIARLSSPPPALPLGAIGYSTIEALVGSARYFANLSIGTVILDEMERHPEMVPWMKRGFEYHSEHALGSCLLCGNDLSSERKDVLGKALDEKIAKLIDDLDQSSRQLDEFIEGFNTSRSALPRSPDLMLALQDDYRTASSALEQRLNECWQLLMASRDAYSRRKVEPTKTTRIDIPEKADVAQACADLQAALKAVNDLITKHNEETANFEKHQEDARTSIRRHFLADGHDAYTAARDAVTATTALCMKLRDEVSALETEIADLRAQVREHGPAAEKITKLVRDYLGHGELSIFAADEGYELHRHAKTVKGPPSEGEKTAIALCYFLSTLQADGREMKDLIVIIDDPISSLDTKAMNYACALIRSLLMKAKQVFILTHNQHCMNEFKKAWRSRAYTRDGTAPTATLNFIDVKVIETTGARSATIVELPKLLREYDSEYHFLCQKLLEFEKAADAHSDYHFMMPNVMRRVLEVFLAFKVPGSHGIKDKLTTLCDELSDQVDDSRVAALERLAQVESHSDSLDDLIGHSSMTIEEARLANGALLHLMKVADARHEKAIRKQCQAA